MRVGTEWIGLLLAAAATGCGNRAARAPDTPVDQVGRDDTGGGDDTGGTGADLGDVSDRITEAVGCADVLIYGYSADATLLVEVRAPGLATAAQQAGAVELLAQLPSAAIAVSLSTGRNLDQLACTDAIDADPSVDDRCTPASGTVSVAVVPNPDAPDPEHEPLGTGHVELDGVGFECESGATAAIGHLSLTAAVGWFPG